MQTTEAILVTPTWTHEYIVEHLLKEILHDQKHILLNQGKIMAAIDNLNANVAKLKTDVDALLAATQQGSEAAIQAAADAVAAIDTEVLAATPAQPASN